MGMVGPKSSSKPGRIVTPIGGSGTARPVQPEALPTNCHNCGAALLSACCLYCGSRYGTLRSTSNPRLGVTPILIKE